MDMLYMANRWIGLLFAACFSYQVIYTVVSLCRKSKLYPKGDRHRFAVLIAARNEGKVIGNLIESIHAQTYNPDLIDVYVVADNCTDDTASIAERHGAIVYKRYSHLRGKGYALDFLLQIIRQERGFNYYDGYFVFDADNLLEPDFIEEMNRVFSAGYRIVTSYRNSKNYGANWLTAGYGLWFLHEARYLNKPRMLLGTSCCISGTGFLMHSEIVKKFGGWPQHLLVEDIQFTAENILAGEKIGYCESAVLYDEQPEDFLQSWAQRMRWVRGHMQITAHYGIKLLRGLFSRNAISCYDFLMTLFPAMLLSIGGVVCTFARFILLMMQELYLSAFQLLASAAATGYGFMLLIGLLTLLTEWKQIHTGPVRKIILLLAFPLFMATYIPIAVACLFKKVEWKPIRHTVAIGLNDISKAKEKLK